MAARDRQNSYEQEGDLPFQGEAIGRLAPRRSKARASARRQTAAGTSSPSDLEQAATPSPVTESDIASTMDARQGGAHSIDQDTKLKANQLATALRNGHVLGKVPLFVLGAGISAGRVPFLSDIAGWFLAANRPTDDPRTTTLLQNLKSGRAARADAAELFSTLQSKQYEELWKQFSKSFLVGIEPRLKLRTGDFRGIANADPSDAHMYLAGLLKDRRAYVLSLNFDGLTVSALKKSGVNGVALHTEQHVRDHFCATDGDSLRAVIKVRGDVFYARCTDPLCPASKHPYPLDRLELQKDSLSSPPSPAPGRDLRCTACQQDTLVLQFSFPGFRIKEETAYPILQECMRFLAQRLSAIVIVGLSGKWDSYLLDFLFHQALERGLPVVDVKPQGDDDPVIDSFRQTYYPSCREHVSDIPHPDPVFMRLRCDADTFAGFLKW